MIIPRLPAYTACVSPQIVFAVCNTAVLPCWLLLLVAPRWAWSQRITTFIAPLVLALAYAWLLISAPHIPGASFSTIAGVHALFSADHGLVAGWLHYLAFDLFIGSWETRDARRLGIAHWATIPSLLLTFLFGPIGLASWLLLRAVLRRSFGIAISEELEAQ